MICFQARRGWGAGLWAPCKLSSRRGTLEDSAQTELEPSKGGAKVMGSHRRKRGEGGGIDCGSSLREK